MEQHPDLCFEKKNLREGQFWCVGFFLGEGAHWAKKKKNVQTVLKSSGVPQNEESF